MKNLLLTSFLTFLYSNFTLFSQTNVVHLNLCSHNEMSDIGHGVNYATNYQQIKSIILDIADSVNINNAKWNMQVESNFILACLQFDNANSSANDLIEFLNNMPNIEVDPHNHLDTIAIANTNFNPYNYADLAYLLDSCGLTTRTNIGGYIYTASDWNTQDENWINWKNGLQGRTFPNYSWTPEVLWGGGTPNHVSDVDPIGVWHPGGATNATYLTNNPSQLLNFGAGCKWLIQETTDVTILLDEISNYISTVNSSAANPSTFYASTIMFDFRSLLVPGYVNKISEVLRGISSFVDDGSIIWQTLTEKKLDWLSSHNNTTDNFIKICSDVTLETPKIESTNTDFLIYPNPVSDVLTIKMNYVPPSTIEVYSLQGVLLKQINVEKDTIEIDFSDVPKGIYIVRFENDSNISQKRILKE